MKSIYTFCMILACLVLSLPNSYAQTNNFTVSGTVSGEGPKETIPGVSVQLKGTQIAVTTDENGKFKINLPDGQGVLVFSHIAYQSTEVAVNNRNTLEVIMQAQSKSLGEVLIVGYGTQRRKDVTGSIASVTADDIKNQPASNLENLLQGRSPGVQVSQSSGAPGSSLSVRIRGGSSINAGNEPLYVIDGVPIINDNQDPSGSSYGTATATNALTSLNPEDIESMQILKDASATAIYGSRANNGVIIITTKRGKGEDVVVAYNGYYGTQKTIRQLDLMNGQQHAEFINDWATANNLAKPFDNPSAIGVGTNWQDELMRTAAIQNHQVSIASGKGDVKYYISGNFFGQDGVILNSGMDRYSFRINTDGKITNKLRFNQTLSYSRTISNSLPSANVGDGNIRSAAERGWVTSPTIPVRDANGNYVTTWYGAFKPDNPVQAVNSIFNELTGDNLIGNFSLDYTIIPGLKFKSLAGISLTNRTLGEYYPGSTTYIGSLFSGLGMNSSRKITNFLNENTLTYTKAFNEKHNLEVLGGVTFQTQKDFEASAQTSGYADDRLGYFKLGGGTGIPVVNTFLSEWSLASVLSRVNYQYNNKFLFTATFRADGASRFGEGNKWGYFPSVAVGYRLGQEEFIQNLNVFDDIKFRVSYGVTGNQEIGAYQSLPRLATDLLYLIGNSNAIGSRQTSLANSELRWEKAAQFDAGVDIAMLNNRLHFVFDYYEKTTNDLLFTINLPGVSGYSTALYNTGQVQNKGIELGLNGTIIDQTFKWDASLNFTRNRNKITSLGRNASNTLFVGYPPGMLLGYVYDGTFKDQNEINAQSAQVGVKPGDARYLDLNGDGLFNTDDRTLIGNPFPDYVWGMNNSFKYKGISLSVFMQASKGGESLRLGSLFNPADITSNKSVDLINRWSPTNPTSNIPRAGVSNWQNVSTNNLQDLSYFKIRNVQLGYTLPSKSLPYKGTAHIFMSGQNILTIAKDYKGYDPDGGINYPTASAITFGVNLTF
ncbi:MAG: TonB-dependent receptor [Pedobacter sp.]|nr:MAG: TonB-dependent receptor [Pedobacter sp.]